MGQEGKIVQGSKLIERLRKEALRNVSLQVEDAEDLDGYIVKGRGEFQMAIIIETMRREGFEFSVGRPHVIFHYDGGKKLEPIEQIIVDCEEEYSGVVTETLGKRKGIMLNYTSYGTGRIRLEFKAPSRALIGYRDKFLTDTKGTGILSSWVTGYEEYWGDFPLRGTGALVCDRTGTAVAYALYNLEDRGELFIVPGDPVYEGMIIGERNREGDLNVNPCRTKQLSNMRAAGKDDAVVLTPVIPLTPESALNMIREDELLEITPVSIRLRKRILSAQSRKEARRQ